MDLRRLASIALVFGMSIAGCGGEDSPQAMGMLPVGPGTAVAGAGTPGQLSGTAGSVAPPIAAGAAGGGRIVPPPTGSSGTAGAVSTPPVGGPPAPMMAGIAAGAAGMAGTQPAGMGGTQPVAPLTGGLDPVMLPAVKGTCPMFATGAITVNNVTLQAWVGAKTGDKGGPLIIYWHGTGGSAATAMGELDKTLVSETMALGGLIVSMESGQQGDPIDWGVFTTGDYEIVDQVVACAIQQLHIDVRRIYTSGASAGGLAAGTLAYARSGYIAGTFPNSGGVAPWPGLNVFQDPAHIPAVFTMHGAKGKDTVVIEFSDSSIQLCNDTAVKGGFAVDCDHGGGHVAAPAALKAAAWTFMKAHPFGTKPSPYAAGLPADFPQYCKIISK